MGVNKHSTPKQHMSTTLFSLQLLLTLIATFLPSLAIGCGESQRGEKAWFSVKANSPEGWGNGDYQFSLNASFVSGQAEYQRPGAGDREEKSLFTFIVDDISVARPMSILTAHDELGGYNCSSDATNVQAHRLGVELRLRVLLDTIKVEERKRQQRVARVMMAEGKVEANEGENGGKEETAADSPKLGEFRMLLTFQEYMIPSSDGRAGTKSGLFPLYSYSMSTVVDDETLKYTVCPLPKGHQMEWNQGASPFCASSWKARNGYSCSKSRLTFNYDHRAEQHRVFLDFTNLEVMFANKWDAEGENKGQKKSSSDGCLRVCPRDQDKFVYQDHQPPKDIPHRFYPYSDHYYIPRHRHFTLFSLVGFVLMAVGAALLTYLLLGWCRKWKEMRRRNALLPSVGYFATLPPHHNQQQQLEKEVGALPGGNTPANLTVPTLPQQLYILPPPYYGMPQQPTQQMSEGAVNEDKVDSDKFIFH